MDDTVTCGVCRRIIHLRSFPQGQFTCPGCGATLINEKGLPTPGTLQPYNPTKAELRAICTELAEAIYERDDFIDLVSGCNGDIPATADPPPKYRRMEYDRP